jgi:ABC-type multidrug transport system ATPase subunit
MSLHAGSYLAAFLSGVGRLDTHEYLTPLAKRMMIGTDVTEGSRADSVEADDQKPLGSGGVLLQARGLTIRTHAGVSVLSDISFHIEAGEMVALTGASHSGKSTLLQSLAGLIKPDRGEILVDGVDLYANLKAFRSSIGFVPAEFGLHPDLTVTEILQDGARLRMPRRASSQDRERRVQTLLETTGLAHAAGARAGTLSRADKRRLNIALELIGEPGLLLLDESLGELTPFEEVQITILLRELCRQGLTIIQADQRARIAGLSDKVIFLAPGGLLAWFGPPDEAFAYMKELVPRGIAKDLFGLKEALEILSDPQPSQGADWAERFKNHEAYETYVDDPLHNKFPDLLLQSRPLLRLRLRNATEEKLPPAAIPRATGMQKIILLVRRNLRLLWREKTLLSMLAAPPLIALVYYFLFSSMVADPNRGAIIMGLLVFVVLLTSALLVQNEISKERAVFQRENRAVSISLPYILSKTWLVGALAAYQGLIWTVVRFVMTPEPASLQGSLASLIILSLLAFTGGILGLIVSALSGAAMTNSTWMLLLTVPQFILSGAIVPAAGLGVPFNLLAAINPSRYALESLLTAAGDAQAVNTTLWSNSVALAAISLFLVVILARIQQGAGRIKI